MNKYAYFREQLNILTQFSAAFDDACVYRYTKDFEPKEKINVRYVFGPKQRVLYDIVNQAKNITLPVISINQTSLKRDSSRTQFKDQNITRQHINSKLVSKIPSPIPVIMELEVSCIVGCKEDLDQIVSNIVSYFNPYIIISWKIPDEFGMDFIDELRTEVTWSGAMDFENPTNIANSDKYKIVGNTSFTIKGWIFPALETPIAPIYVINSNFITAASNSILDGYDDYPALSANDTTDNILISAYPEFTNTFYSGSPVYDNISISNTQSHTFSFYGKRFGFNNSWYLSGQQVAPLVLESIDTAKFPTISAYRVPNNLITTVNDNIAVVSFETNYLSAGKFTFVTANSAGWANIDTEVVVI